MDEKTAVAQMKIICVIVNNTFGSKVLKAAKQLGVLGGTIFLGKGTVKSKVLEFLDLNDIRKEIVLLITEKEAAHRILEELNRVFKFEKPHHGIAFTSSLTGLIGVHKYGDIKTDRSEKNTMYDAIYTIVERGNAEAVMEAANKAGARGGTVINARGCGIHETAKLFSMYIEPEKEIVLILSENSYTDNIVESIRNELKIDEPGKGVIFVQSLNSVYGLY